MGNAQRALVVIGLAVMIALVLEIGVLWYFGAQQPPFTIGGP